jgi:hypothetical protein
MFWVLIYIATNFLAPIPLISPRINDFSSQFPPKSMNSSHIISQKIANRLKPARAFCRSTQLDPLHGHQPRSPSLRLQSHTRPPPPPTQLTTPALPARSTPSAGPRSHLPSCLPHFGPAPCVHATSRPRPPMHQAAPLPARCASTFPRAHLALLSHARVRPSPQLTARRPRPSRSPLRSSCPCLARPRPRRHHSAMPTRQHATHQPLLSTPPPSSLRRGRLAKFQRSAPPAPRPEIAGPPNRLKPDYIF